MYNRILNKLCKITGNIFISKILSDFIIFIWDIIFFIRYFMVFNSEKLKKIDCNINNCRKKFQVSNKIIRKEFSELDLSIIIPAYNSENTIEECIKSIIQQKINYTYEVIVINDGSTDSTLDKIKKILEENVFKNMVVISQQNGGISVARNKGLEVSRGRYIMFCDSDDLLTRDSINKLLEKTKISEFDIIEGNYYNSYINKKVVGKPLWKNSFEVNLSSNKEFIYKIKGFPWGRIYNRKLWMDVEFPIGFDYEDTVIKYTIFRKASTFLYINEFIYEYRINSDSITNKLKGQIKSLDTYYIIPYLIDLNYKLGIKFDSVFYKIILNQLGSLLYYRTNGVEDKFVDMILLEAKNLLLELEDYCPKLNIKDKLLKDAIISENKQRWILCCKNR
ncbi:MAG: glycosyltransferase [Clostridioides difficile]|nr:glycosyltransferase [Clostridioides difficile]